MSEKIYFLIKIFPLHLRLIKFYYKIHLCRIREKQFTTQADVNVRKHSNFILTIIIIIIVSSLLLFYLV